MHYAIIVWLHIPLSLPVNIVFGAGWEAGHSYVSCSWHSLILITQ